MKTLPAEASDQEILDTVREWVEFLAEERYDEAYHFFVNTEHNPRNWSPQLLKTVIQTYGFHDKREFHRVTPVEKTTGGVKPRHDIHRDDDNDQQGFIWFDLPLDGKWSDLTAVLTFHANNKRLSIELESIEVM